MFLNGKEQEAESKTKGRGHNASLLGHQETSNTETSSLCLFHSHVFWVAEIEGNSFGFFILHASKVFIVPHKVKWKQWWFAIFVLAGSRCQLQQWSHSRVTGGHCWGDSMKVAFNASWKILLEGMLDKRMKVGSPRIFFPWWPLKGSYFFCWFFYLYSLFYLFHLLCGAASHSLKIARSVMCAVRPWGSIAKGMSG